MAIAIVNTTNAVVAAAGTTGITVTKPGSLANGHVMYAFISRTDFALTNKWTCSGWTDICPATHGFATGNDTELTILRKVVTNAGGEPANYTFVNTHATSYQICGFIVALSGVDNTTPEDITVPAYGQNSNAPNPATLNATSATAGAFVIAVLQESLLTAAAVTPVAPSTYTLITNGNANSATGSLDNQTILASKTLGAAGSTTGTTAWANTGTTSTVETLTAVVLVRQAVTTVQATASAAFGGLGATVDATVEHVVQATASAAFGGLTATADATVIPSGPPPEATAAVGPSGGATIVQADWTFATSTRLAIESRRVQMVLYPAAQLFTRNFSGAIASSSTLVKVDNKPLVGIAASVGAISKLDSKPLAGTVTPAGAVVMTRVVVRAFAGTVASAGAITKAVTKTAAGVLTPAGAASKAITKFAAGAVTSTGIPRKAVTKATLLANITPTAIARKLAVKATFTGATTPVGTPAKLTTKAPFTGTLTSTGAPAKLTTKPLTGALTSASTVVRIKVVIRNFAGTIAPAGAVVARAITKTVTGVLSPAGAASKLIGKKPAGTIAPAGAITATKVLFRNVSGTIASVGLAARRFNRNATAAVASVGALAKAPKKTNSGTVAPVGAFVGGNQSTVSGNVAPAGVATRLTAKALAGSATSSGSTVLGRFKVVSGALTPSGAITAVKVVIKSVTGAMASAGLPRKQANKVPTGTIAPVGTIPSKFPKWTLNGTLTSAGAPRKAITKAPFTGTVTSSSVVTRIKVVIKAVSGAMASVGVARKQTSKTPTGTVTPVGVIGPRAVNKKAAGTVTPAGAMAPGNDRFVSGAVVPTGIARKRIDKFPTGTVAPTNVTRKTAVKATLTAAISAAGVAVKTVLKPSTGTVTSAGAQVRQRQRTVTGSIASSSTIRRAGFKGLIAVLAPVGTAAKYITRRAVGFLNLSGVATRDVILPATSPALAEIHETGASGTIHEHDHNLSLSENSSATIR